MKQIIFYLCLVCMVCCIWVCVNMSHAKYVEVRKKHLRTSFILLPWATRPHSTLQIPIYYIVLIFLPSWWVSTIWISFLSICMSSFPLSLVLCHLVLHVSVRFPAHLHLYMMLERCLFTGDIWSMLFLQVINPSLCMWFLYFILD